jgi:hypothetical protein
MAIDVHRCSYVRNNFSLIYSHTQSWRYCKHVGINTSTIEDYVCAMHTWWTPLPRYWQIFLHHCFMFKFSIMVFTLGTDGATHIWMLIKSFLDLSKNKLTALPDLSLLGELERIDCSHNIVTSIPDMSRMVHVAHLDLRCACFFLCLSHS